MALFTRDKACAVGRYGTAAPLLLALALGLFASPCAAQAQPGGFKGKQKKTKTKKKAKTDNKEDDTPKHAEKLLKLPSMKISKPLMDIPKYEATEKKLRQLRYKQVLQNGNWNAQNQKVIQQWVDWRLKSFTMKEFKVKKIIPDPNNPGKFKTEVVIEKNKIGDRRSEFLREFRTAGGGKNRRFREEVSKEIVKQAAKLLDNNFYVRLHVIKLVSDLNVMPANLIVNPPEAPEAFKGSARFLLDKVIKDKNQPDALRVIAVNGLKRIGHLSKGMKVTERQEIAEALMKEFERPKLHTWYQRRLLDAMSAIDLPDFAGAGAKISQVLATTMNDAGRDPKVRAQAAFALSRASQPANLNVDLLMHEYVQLTIALSKLYNADIAAGKKTPHWANNFLHIYLAFHPLHRYEPALYERRVAIADRKPWLKARYSGNAKMTSAYKVILPVVQHVLQQSQKEKPTGVTGNTLTDLTGWVATNRPNNLRLQPGLDPIRPKKVAAAGKKPANGATKTVPVAGP